MMKKIKNLIVFSMNILLCLFLLPFTNSLAQEPTNTPDLNPGVQKLFQSDELIEMTIDFNMKEVLRDVGEDRTYHDASITYSNTDGQEITLPVRVRTRGHFRREPVNCNFPPIRLNFKKPETENTIFEGQDILKLVTHCRSRSKQFEQFVIKEYLVYKLYNLFTEESYKVRIARITYEDSNGKKKPITKFGFFLEPTEQMIARNNAEKIEINIHQESTNKGKMMILCVFQYMVGNTDWSVQHFHNIVLIRKDPLKPPVAVPYDFDWCGLVNAPYAVPAPQLGIENVRQRRFWGYCRPKEDYHAAFEVFMDKKPAIYELIENSPYINEKELKDVMSYLDQFYEIINDPRSIEYEFYQKCREYEGNP